MAETITTAQAAKIVKTASDAQIVKIAVASEKAIAKLETTSDAASTKILKVAEEVSTNLRNVAAQANEAATKLLATQAAAAVQVVNAKGSDDHDLLIELRTKMQGLLDAITEVRTGTSAQIKEHEVKLNKQDDRITACEKKNGVNSTILAIYSIAVIAMIGLMITHMLK